VLRLDKIGMCDILPFSSVKTHNSNQQIFTTVSDEQDAPIRIVIPFKDQKSANVARHQLGDLSRKIDAVVHPVYTSQKIKGQFKPKEHKPPIVNQQKRCLLLQAWSVRCRLRVDIYINVRRNISDINNRQPRKG